MPPDLPPDLPPIYLICGAPASGKSSSARALAAAAERGVHIDVDQLRHMVIAGVEHPGNEWPPALVQQLGLARATALEMALRYRSAGFLVAIDDFWDPVSQLSEYEALTSHPRVLRVILLPHEEKVHAQALARAGSAHAAAYFTPGIRAIYADLGRRAATLAAVGWCLLDSTDDDVHQTAHRLQALSAA